MKKRLAPIGLALALGGPVLYAQPANPLTGGARLNYGIIKSFITRAAVKMPEEHYPFRPTPDVRSFAQLIGHLADANYRLCSIVAGQDPPTDAGIEKSKTTKGELDSALRESFAYCDKQYADMTDAMGTPLVKFDAGGEGNRVPLQMPRLTVLAFHAQHAFEHYGNIVTYMRIKGIVPPSSEPAGRGREDILLREFSAMPPGRNPAAERPFANHVRIRLRSELCDPEPRHGARFYRLTANGRKQLEA